MKYQKKIKYLTINDEPDPNNEEKLFDKFYTNLIADEPDSNNEENFVDKFYTNLIADEPDQNNEEKFGDKFIFFVYFLMFKHNFAFYIYIKIFIIQKYDIKLCKLPVIFFKIVQKNRLDYEYLTSYYHNCINN